MTPLTIPPHDAAAERHILGAALRHGLLDAVSHLREEDFYLDAHQKIWRRMRAMWLEGKRLDVVVLEADLRREKLLADVGGEAFLAELWEHATYNVDAHALIVWRHSLSRQALNAITAGAANIRDQVGPPEELIAGIESDLFKITTQGAGNEVGSAHALIGEVLRDIDARESGDGVVGVPTGFDEFDDRTGGLRPSELNVLGARPSVGKSALALAIAAAARAAGRPVLFVSLEMSARELAARLLSMGSGVPLSIVSRHRPTGAQVDSLLATSRAYKDGPPLYVDDTPSTTLARLTSVVRRLVRKEAMRAGEEEKPRPLLVVVDYLQLIQPDNPKANRVEQVSGLSRGLKLLARRCDVPLLVLAQLNRASEERPNAEPRLADLRESGSIEQDADNVYLLHPSPENQPADPVHKIRLLIRKQRNGPTGEVVLAYRRANVRFENPAPSLVNMGGQS